MAAMSDKENPVLILQLATSGSSLRIDKMKIRTRVRIRIGLLVTTVISVALSAIRYKMNRQNNAPASLWGHLCS